MTTVRTSLPEAARHMSLRERKKLKTRIAIRNATYQLIEKQGYDATTVEQIYWTEHDYQGDLLDLLDRTLATLRDLPKR